MSGKPENLEGKKFGRLTILNITDERDSNRSTIWKCICSCKDKTIVKVPSRSLKSGRTQSCGCLRLENLKSKITKHGACRTKSKEGNSQLDYVIWQGIKSRCYVKTSRKYKDYGARGIGMFKEWKKDFTKFATYIRTLPNCPADDLLTSRLKGRRLKVTLDRINNNKGYKPKNLKWSTPKQQANNKRSNIVVRYKGETLTLTQAAEKYGVVSKDTVHNRFTKMGWSLRKSLLTPKSKTRRH